MGKPKRSSVFALGTFHERGSLHLKQRIFLTGLSGSGKSTVARQVAKLLGWDFVDTDALLSERCGLPVGQVLVEYGEERFRQVESEALVSAASRDRIVIATGGGAVISESNRTFMREHGMTVYLQVSVETAWQRVQEHMRQSGISAVRPLVVGTDGHQRLQELYAVRKQWYEQTETHINTDENSPNIVAGRVVAFALAHGYLSNSSLPPETVTLKPGTVSSQAVVEWGGLHHLPQALQSSGVSKRVFIVTDTEVGRLYIEPVQDLLAEAGFVPQVFTIPAGESSKSLQYWQQILDWLVEHKAEHQEAIVALGGGVAGDLAGFVAATYQRGVPLVQVPTSLLAQVDAAIGGKTGINHPLGKNLIGAFYQPKLIIVDPAFLLTLPERMYREGWAEIVKYGMILDADLFEMLEMRTSSLHARDATLLAEIVARCIRLKMDVVQRDERDGGLRNILNYGHTFGHALEALTDYGTWLHGEAVSIGMEVAAQIAVSRGLLANEHAVRQHKLLHALDLPVHCPGVDTDAVLELMQRDKKVRAGRMRWVLPTRIGHAQVYAGIPLEVVQDAVATVCSRQ
jgi:shikimate kinase/3-dehydroquinate synthase